MKIAYGTYAIPDVALEDAILELEILGFDGIEICVGNRHEDAMPANVTPVRRTRLRDLLGKCGMGVPALFLLGSVYTPDAAQHAANLEHLKACAQLARDLGAGGTPVLAMGFGGQKDQWEQVRQPLADLLGDIAQVAKAEGFILAAEAHCGAAVDRSERITWLLDAVGSPHVRLHFDIVHLFLAGEPIAESVARLAPYTAHTHITDAIRHPDGTFELVLLGEGQLDATAYMRAMQQAGWTGFITLEVSTMVWAKEGYDFRSAARICYDNLSTAFARAGVARG